MMPVSTTTCTIIDASTTQCVTQEPSSATGTPAVLWHYDAGELVIVFVLVATFALHFFSGLFHAYSQ